MVDPVSTIDVTEKLIHIFGIPSIVAAIVWSIRQYDASRRAFVALHDNTKQALSATAEIKAAVDTIQTNHLKHLEDGIIAIGSQGTRQTELLVVIADRLKRD
jgi:hypothetical protein